MNIIGYHKYGGKTRTLVNKFLKGAQVYGHNTKLYELPSNIEKSWVMDIPKADLYVFSGGSNNKDVLQNYGPIGNNKLIITDTYTRSVDRKIANYYKAYGENVHMCISNTMNCIGSVYKDLPSDRWELIKKCYKINVLPWKTKGNFALITYSSDSIYLKHKRNIQAFIECIKTCKKRGLEVIVCSHPREVARQNTPYGDASKIKEFKNLGCTFDVGSDKYIKDASCVIGYASSMTFKATTLGIPVFPVLYCYISNLYEDYDMTSIDKFLDDMPRPNRNKWFNWIAYQQWTLREISQGLGWKFMVEDKNMEFKDDVNKNSENILC